MRIDPVVNVVCTFHTPRSMLGGPPSYSNHDSNPNARLISKSNARVEIQVSLSSEEKCLLFSHILQVLRPIKAGEEITVRWDKDDIRPPLRLPFWDSLKSIII